MLIHVPNDDLDIIKTFEVCHTPVKYPDEDVLKLVCRNKTIYFAKLLSQLMLLASVVQL